MSLILIINKELEDNVYCLAHCSNLSNLNKNLVFNQLFQDICFRLKFNKQYDHIWQLLTVYLYRLYKGAGCPLLMLLFILFSFYRWHIFLSMFPCRANAQKSYDHPGVVTPPTPLRQNSLTRPPSTNNRHSEDEGSLRRRAVKVYFRNKCLIWSAFDLKQIIFGLTEGVIFSFYFFYIVV